MNSKNENKADEILSGLNGILDFKDTNEIDDFEIQILHLDFINVIQQLMDEKGISKTELAEKMGTSKSYITQLFTGDKLLNLKFLTKIQKVFDLKFSLKYNFYSEKIEEDNLLKKIPIFSISKDYNSGIPKANLGYSTDTSSFGLDYFSKKNNNSYFNKNIAGDILSEPLQKVA